MSLQYWHFCSKVLDYRPLQQGLRLLFCFVIFGETSVLDYRPLQQGLRL